MILLIPLQSPRLWLASFWRFVRVFGAISFMRWRWNLWLHLTPWQSFALALRESKHYSHRISRPESSFILWTAGPSISKLLVDLIGMFAASFAVWALYVGVVHMRLPLATIPTMHFLPSRYVWEWWWQLVYRGRQRATILGGILFHPLAMVLKSQ